MVVMSRGETVNLPDRDNKSHAAAFSLLECKRWGRVWGRACNAGANDERANRKLTPETALHVQHETSWMSS